MPWASFHRNTWPLSLSCPRAVRWPPSYTVLHLGHDAASVSVSTSDANVSASSFQSVPSNHITSTGGKVFGGWSPMVCARISL